MQLPPHLENETLEKIENRPGVYHFYDDDDTLLYVGKSVALRKRIKSHFRKPGDSHKAQKLFMHTATVKTYPTAGDVGAQIRELAHIKDFQPIYNKQSRAKKLLSVAQKQTDADGYYYPEIARVGDFDEINLESVLGVFRSSKQAKSVISTLAKDHKLCPKRLQISSKARDGACFYRQLGQCRGACIKKVSAEDFNARVREAFLHLKVRRWPFDGPKTITETYGDRTDQFVIDNWHLRSATTSQRGTKTSFFDKNQLAGFNYDAYKVFANHIDY